MMIASNQTNTLNTSTGGGKNHFPSHLHRLLSSTEGNDTMTRIVSWRPHGRCFVIHDQDEFSKALLPIWFPRLKYPSFQRQLHKHGFRRLHGQGPDKGAYYHEMFQRGAPDLATCMTPLKKGGKRGRKPQATEPTFENEAVGYQTNRRGLNLRVSEALLTAAEPHFQASESWSSSSTTYSSVSSLPNERAAAAVNARLLPTNPEAKSLIRRAALISDAAIGTNHPAQVGQVSAKSSVPSTPHSQLTREVGVDSQEDMTSTMIPGPSYQTSTSVEGGRTNICKYAAALPSPSKVSTSVGAGADGPKESSLTNSLLRLIDRGTIPSHNSASWPVGFPPLQNNLDDDHHNDSNIHDPRQAYRQDRGNPAIRTAVSLNDRFAVTVQRHVEENQLQDQIQIHSQLVQEQLQIQEQLEDFLISQIDQRTVSTAGKRTRDGHHTRGNGDIASGGGNGGRGRENFTKGGTKTTGREADDVFANDESMHNGLSPLREADDHIFADDDSMNAGLSPLRQAVGDIFANESIHDGLSLQADDDSFIPDESMHDADIDELPLFGEANKEGIATTIVNNDPFSCRGSEVTKEEELWRQQAWNNE